MPQSNQKKQAPQPSRQSSLKQKYISREDAGIYTPPIAKGPNTPLFRPTNTRRYNTDLGRETRTVSGNIERGWKMPDPVFQVEPNYGDYGVIPKNTDNTLRGHFADQKVVTGRDAYNTKLMRGELANRAAAAAEAAGVRAKRSAAVRRGVMAGLGVAAMAASDRGARRMSQSDEDMTERNNTYGSAALGGSNGTYPNQGKFSKALGVKNTKPGM
jgi:hypothetical protein